MIMFQLNETLIAYNKIEIWPNKVLLSIYAIVFIIGISGNILTIYLVLFIKKMQSMTNKFISNLAFADLLVIFLVIPENALRLMLKQPPDIGGHLFCKFTAFIQGISLGVSVTTLTAISVDRYYIIYKPMKARSISRSRIKLVVTLTWIFSILIMSPMLMVMKYEEFYYDELTNFTSLLLLERKFVICREEWPNLELKLAYNVFLAFVLFLFPVLFMSYAYIKVSKTLCLAVKKEVPIIKKVKYVNSFSLKQNIRYKTKNLDDTLTQIQFENNHLDDNTLDNEEHQIDENKIVLKETKKEYSYSFCSSERNSVNEIFQMIEQKTIETNMRNSKKSRISRSLKKDSTKTDNRSAIESLYFQLKIIKKSKGETSTLHTSSTAINNKNEKAINNLLSSRRRVVKLLIILVFLFFISWLPYHIVGIAIDLMHIYQRDDQHILTRFLVEQIFPVTLFLAHANSAQNPICFLMLRRDFLKTLRTKIGCCF